MPPSLIGTSPDSRIWLSVDCCGLSMALVTWFLIGYAVYIVSDIIYRWHGLSTTGIALEATMLLLAAMSYMSHIRAMLTDPGAVPLGARPLPEKEEYERQTAEGPNVTPYRSWCRKCESYKPPRAHHDSCTDRCVSKMDHFCPWVNNCVGVLNHKLFLLFLFYIALISAFTLTLVAARAASCAAAASERTPAPATVRRGRRRLRHDESMVIRVFEAMFESGECHLGLPVFFLVMEGLLFLLFTAAMICDQYTTVVTGVAGIDRRKGVSPSKNDTVHEIFGDTPGFKWHWLWPAPADFGHHRNQILGYMPPGDGGAKLV